MCIFYGWQSDWECEFVFSFGPYYQFTAWWFWTCLTQAKFLFNQVNNVLCFFGKLDSFVKTKLFKAYCTSMYGCKLWSLVSPSVEQFCVDWRKALRRILDLLYNCHTRLNLQCESKSSPRSLKLFAIFSFVVNLCNWKWLAIAQTFSYV